ncbi:ankyrin [Mytilinidion resinicola]|uniref:Ankyrin n=1 Tax=Mytilinidion resinicola TaxID=574789 RepID=A0A6A6Z2P8_9PEZI|nr:ankyrin [Mytilinidion resinicola]KAF2814455.1 ankyrin [Mytilinidion resinicola]
MLMGMMEYAWTKDGFWMPVYPPKPVPKEPLSFLEACRQGDITRVKALASEHDRDSLTEGLRAALSEDCVEIASYLLDNGAVLDTPALLAVRTEFGVQVLLDHGWDINQPLSNTSGVTMLTHLLPRDRWDLVNWMLHHGARPTFGPRFYPLEGSDPTCYRNSGASLEAAAMHCSPVHGSEILPMLVNAGAKLGADANALGYVPNLPHKGTPLHCAAMHGRLLEARWLLEHGADPSVYDHDVGLPASYWSELRGHSDITKLIDQWYWSRGLVDVADGEKNALDEGGRLGRESPEALARRQMADLTLVSKGPEE